MRIQIRHVVLAPIAVILCFATVRAVARDGPARKGTVAGNLRQIAEALAGYAGDYKGRYPAEWAVGILNHHARPGPVRAEEKRG